MRNERKRTGVRRTKGKQPAPGWGGCPSSRAVNTVGNVDLLGRSTERTRPASNAKDREDPTSPMQRKEPQLTKGYVGQAAIPPNAAEADGSIHCFAHATIA